MDDDETTRLRRAVARLARALNAAATDEGLTPTQSSVLALIAAHGPLSVGGLIELEGLNPSMTSRVLGKLDGHGLIRRRPGTDDQRTVSAEVTPEGRQVHRRIKARRNTFVAECIDTLPAEQAADLARALPALDALAKALATRG